MFLHLQLDHLDICETIAEVITGPIVEKILCHVKQERTAFQASKICQKYDMELYQPNSSPEALSVLKAFGKSAFKSAPKAELYVGGRNKNRCQTMKGNGKLQWVWCGIPFNFVCEYSVPVINATCDEYRNNWSNLNGVDLSSYTNPQACWIDTLVDENTFITTTDAVAKEDVYAFDCRYSEVYRLPVDLVNSFPNLQVIYCENHGIDLLTYRSLRGLTKLVYLGLDFNYIEVLDANVFKDLTSLQRLDMSE
jgi:Leucine-rich repeat (LRR) protein